MGCGLFLSPKFLPPECPHSSSGAPLQRPLLPPVMGPSPFGPLLSLRGIISTSLIVMKIIINKSEKKFRLTLAALCTDTVKLYNMGFDVKVILL